MSRILLIVACLALVYSCALRDDKIDKDTDKLLGQYCFYSNDLSNQSSQSRVALLREAWAKYEHEEVLLPPLSVDGTFYFVDNCAQSIITPVFADSENSIQLSDHETYTDIYQLTTANAVPAKSN